MCFAAVEIKSNKGYPNCNAAKYKYSKQVDMTLNFHENYFRNYIVKGTFMLIWKSANTCVHKQKGIPSGYIFSPFTSQI